MASEVSVGKGMNPLMTELLKESESGRIVLGGKPYSVKPVASMAWTYAGIFAGLITLVAVSFQIAGIVRNESACDLAWEFIILTSVTQTFWLAYSIGNRLLVNTVTSAIGLMVMVTFAVLKVMYDTPSVCEAAHAAKESVLQSARVPSEA